MRNLIITTLVLGACAFGKAPGTNSGEMSAAEHRQACLDYKQRAAAYREQAARLHGDKGTHVAEVSANMDDDYARQHAAAAHQVDPNGPDCGQPRDTVVHAP